MKECHDRHVRLVVIRDTFIPPSSTSYGQAAQQHSLRHYGSYHSTTIVRSEPGAAEGVLLFREERVDSAADETIDHGTRR